MAKNSVGPHLCAVTPTFHNCKLKSGFPRFIFRWYAYLVASLGHTWLFTSSVYPCSCRPPFKNFDRKQVGPNSKPMTWHNARATWSQFQSKQITVSGSRSRHTKGSLKPLRKKCFVKDRFALDDLQGWILWEWIVTTHKLDRHSVTAQVWRPMKRTDNIFPLVTSTQWMGE